MFTTYLKPVIAGAFVFGLATAAFAATRRIRRHVRDGACQRQGGEDRLLDQQVGRRQDLFFGNETARTEFMKDPQGNIAKAQSVL